MKTMSESTLFTNIAGNPVDGFKCYGIFDSFQEAVDWKDGYGGDCWVAVMGEADIRDRDKLRGLLPKGGSMSAADRAILAAEAGVHGALPPGWDTVTARETPCTALQYYCTLQQGEDEREYYQSAEKYELGDNYEILTFSDESAYVAFPDSDVYLDARDLASEVLHKWDENVGDSDGLTEFLKEYGCAQPFTIPPSERGLDECEVNERLPAHENLQELRLLTDYATREKGNEDDEIEVFSDVVEQLPENASLLAGYNLALKLAPIVAERHFEQRRNEWAAEYALNVMGADDVRKFNDWRGTAYETSDDIPAEDLGEFYEDAYALEE